MIAYLTWISFIAGGLLVLMLLLSIVGGLDFDMDIDMSSDSDTAGGDGLGIFKAGLTFLSIGAWTMKLLLLSEMTTPFALVLGTVAGLAAMYILHIIVKTLLNNDENVNWEADDAVLQLGEVYLKIPAQEGNGIINVEVKGATREMKAKSLDNKEIKTGAKIRVMEIAGEFALVVQEDISNKTI